MTIGKLRLFGYTATAAASIALVWTVATTSVTGASPAAAPAVDAIACDMSHYKAASGLTASMDQNVLTVAWNGQNGSEMRTRYAIEGGQPLVRAVRAQVGRPVGRSGRTSRRVSLVGVFAGCRSRGSVESCRSRVDAGRDHQEPLVRVLGRAAGDEAGARDRAAARRVDIKRGSSTFHTSSCSVKTDGATIEVTFRAVDGDFRRRSALHRVQGHEPDSRDALTRRKKSGLPTVERPEGILDRPDAARRVA